MQTIDYLRRVVLITTQGQHITDYVREGRHNRCPFAAPLASSSDDDDDRGDVCPATTPPSSEMGEDDASFEYLEIPLVRVIEFLSVANGRVIEFCRLRTGREGGEPVASIANALPNPPSAPTPPPMLPLSVPA